MKKQLIMQESAESERRQSESSIFRRSELTSSISTCVRSIQWSGLHTKRYFLTAKRRHSTQVLVPFNSMIAFQFEGSSCLQFDISSSIVDVIIDDLLFHSDDVESVMYKKRWTSFKRVVLTMVATL